MLGWLVLQRLVIQPMTAVHNGMRALARQDFSHRVDVSTRDESEELADTFNGLSRQLNAARLIQSSFFPRSLPESTHYRLAGFSLPCDATGGDYFDAFELDDGRLAVVLADVSGHGLGPSLLMASCRAALRALAHAGLEPADLLDRLNALLLHDLDGGRFITMIYGELESDGTFTYANAGHGPALVARRSQVTHLASHRPPLGIQLDLNGEERQTTLQLEPEDRILLTSDGLSEAAGSDGEHFGLQRIEAVLADSDLDAYQVVEQLRQKLLDHTGDRPTLDDVTILCVDRNGEPSVTSGSV
jgi:serine phosphatase RsbU (regulator of sigma subunit)